MTDNPRTAAAILTRNTTRAAWEAHKTDCGTCGRKLRASVCPAGAPLWVAYQRAADVLKERRAADKAEHQGQLALFAP
jgi:hypothetical protein